MCPRSRSYLELAFCQMRSMTTGACEAVGAVGATPSWANSAEQEHARAASVRVLTANPRPTPGNARLNIEISPHFHRKHPRRYSTDNFDKVNDKYTFYS